MSAPDYFYLEPDEIAALPLFSRVTLVRRNMNQFLDPKLFAATAAKFTAALTQPETSTKLRERAWPALIKAATALVARQEHPDDVTEELFNAFMTTMVSIEKLWTPRQRETMQEWLRGDFRFLDHQKAMSPVAVVEETPMRLRFAETVLRFRTSRFVIVLEKCYDNHNYAAVLRTAECLGVQRVWLVKPVEFKNKNIIPKRITRGNDVFLDVRTFDTTSECIAALREDGRTIWATDLSQKSISLGDANIQVPEKLAVVFGRESEGVTEEMLSAADARVYLPLFGFTESLNLSVATALVMQRLFDLCPDARGDLTDAERGVLREKWYQRLARDNERKGDEYKHFLAKPPPPLPDFRRFDGSTPKDSNVPKKIQKRLADKEMEVKEGEERAQKRQRTDSSTMDVATL